eukprot:11552331-Heterocapsa_arctica.AAC.1
MSFWAVMDTEMIAQTGIFTVKGRKMNARTVEWRKKLDSKILTSVRRTLELLIWGSMAAGSPGLGKTREMTL